MELMCVFHTLLLFGFLKMVHCSARLELTILQYSNPSGTTAEGEYCDRLLLSNSTDPATREFCDCAGMETSLKISECDHLFEICVSTLSGSDSSLRDCDLINATLGPVEDKDSFVLADLRQPLVLDFSVHDSSELEVKVRVMDSDTSNDPENVERLPPVNITFSTTEQEYLLANRTRLSLQVRWYCDFGWYGDNCSVLCIPADDVTGHYTCGIDGTKNCLPGWEDESSNCLTSVDDCAIVPCMNGARCQDGHKSFICHCISDHTGLRCEIPPDPCDDGPCQNAGNCTSVVETHGQNTTAEYACSCPLGYMGDHCENIDHCATSPCEQGACENSAGSFFCRCDPGWQGTFCDADIDECQVSTPCQNGGTCLNSPGSYECSCEPGFTGARCEQEIPCSCLHGGSCVYTNNTSGGYNVTCTCVGGWSGADCSISPCASSPCENNGDCVDSNDGYFCDCQSGWQGTTCDADIDECQLSTPCQNGGTCQNSPGSYECSCEPGFTGATCEQEIPCSCQHGGSCVYTNNDVTCNCVGGWSGSDCSISPCSTSPCQHLGHCVESANSVGFVCTCGPGYTGGLCEEDIDDCLTHGCQHDSVCVDGVNSYTCSCPEGYRGNRCQTAKDLADEPYTLTFDGVMDREDINRARSEIADFVAKTESVPTDELSVQHQASSCKTRSGGDVTIFVFQVLDTKEESLRVDNLESLSDQLSAALYTGSECVEPGNIRESNQGAGVDGHFLATVLCITIGLLSLILIVLVLGFVLYSRRHNNKRPNRALTANGSFKNREVAPVVTTSNSDHGFRRAPRSFRCHSDDCPRTSVVID